jgi:hypothetical protein
MKPLLLVACLAAFACGCQNHSAPRPGSASGVGDRHQPNHAQPVADALDTRIPVPLLPRMAQHQRENMRDHLAAVQEILAFVAQNDFAGVEKAAARIESSAQMQAMCQHMGMGAPGFTELALNFHRTADSIAPAARKQDEKEVLKALSATVSTCVGCHAVYRQQIVDEATWQRLTAEKQ